MSFLHQYLKLILSLITVVFFIETVNAQRFHANIYAGALNYQGDLQDKRFTFNQAHFGGGLGLSYDLTDHFSVRGVALLGKVSADDKYGRNKDRNLNFTSRIYEAQLGVEYYITPIADHALTPYVFGSVALYHFSPYTADTTGARIYLSPYSTEGEGFLPGKDNYKRTQLAVPFGAGVKLSLSENINVGLELGFRKLFTDYLDDVSGNYVDEALLLTNRGPKAVEMAYRGGELKTGSLEYPPAGTQRGGAKNKDWYYFTGVTISFRLGGGSDIRGRRAEYGCPVNVR